MKLIIIKDNFKRGLIVIERITGRNLTLPILNNVLLKTSNDSLILSGTNLELGINYQTLSKVEKEGQITVPAKLLYNLINFIPEEKIYIEAKKDILFLSGKTFKSQIKGLPAEDFPIIPGIKEGADFIEINNAPLLEGILKVINFCSLGQIHPELSGIYFNFQKEKLELVSTDSFRLAQKDLYYQNKIKQPFSFILPQRTARELANILSEKDTKADQGSSRVKIYYDPNQIFFEFASKDPSFSQFRFTSRLIEGEYPNYQEIIPKSSRTHTVLNKNNFLSQIKSTSLFSGQVNKVKIKIDPKQGLVNLFSQSADMGEMSSSLPAEVRGEQTEAAFNYRFLLDGLSGIDGEKIAFDMNGEEGPAVLKPIDASDYVYILMPIKS